MTGGGGHDSYLTNYQTKMSREPLLDTCWAGLERHASKRVMGLEPTISCLGSKRSTTELHPRTELPQLYRDAGTSCQRIRMEAPAELLPPELEGCFSRCLLRPRTLNGTPGRYGSPGDDRQAHGAAPRRWINDAAVSQLTMTS